MSNSITNDGWLSQDKGVYLGNNLDKRFFFVSLKVS